MSNVDRYPEPASSTVHSHKRASKRRTMLLSQHTRAREGREAADRPTHRPMDGLTDGWSFEHSEKLHAIMCASDSSCEHHFPDSSRRRLSTPQGRELISFAIARPHPRTYQPALPAAPPHSSHGRGVPGLIGLYRMLPPEGRRNDAGAVYRGVHACSDSKRPRPQFIYDVWAMTPGRSERFVWPSIGQRVGACHASTDGAHCRSLTSPTGKVGASSARGAKFGSGPELSWWDGMSYTVYINMTNSFRNRKRPHCSRLCKKQHGSYPRLQ
ncbi:hypothetical protein M433DRAFT_639 [Acidomyces richmondensis BFW]|nr:hypothetical protein M433DRAFT_639 [Acidomyces richmondensis BFW]